MPKNETHPLEAIQLRSNRWAVRPAGQLGTIGWYPYPWEVRYVTAPTAEAAIKLVTKRSAP